MKHPQRAALMAGALLAMTAPWPAAAQDCTLVLSEHRSTRRLARLPLDQAAPKLQIRFTHSVLNTPVEDHYVFRHDSAGWRAHLVAERWVGEGYGLPIAAGPGESLHRAGDGWQLQLDRVVDPLVVLPLPAQRMRVVVEGQPELLLGQLSTRSIVFTVSGCLSH